jgi:hypothetical protein
MHQSSLSCGGEAGTNALRFTWLRSNRNPVVVLISRLDDDRTTLTAMVTNGRGGYHPGAVTNEIRRQLSPGQWSELIRRLELATFWAMDTSVPDDMFDGAEWVVEARRGGIYHVVTRTSPDNGPYRQLGLYFITLSTLQVSRGDLY